VIVNELVGVLCKFIDWYRIISAVPRFNELTQLILLIVFITAGVQDTRFQALMPDPLHFLGVTKIHNFISMSDMKYNAIVNTGITIVNRVEIPPDMVPDDAQVEITAKVFHGYNAGKAYQGIDAEQLKACKGRDYNYDASDGDDDGNDVAKDVKE